MKAIKNLFKFILSMIIIVILIYILNLVYTSYKQKYFNDFNKAELVLHRSEFIRDKDEQYSKGVYSYKIKSDIMNDATLYKTLAVEKNTPYKVSCMVKTENVVSEKSPSESGAHISIIDTVEKSKSLQGTNDWQELVFYFNSYGRETINLAFRLGGFQDNCTGTAWFSDFKVEKGIQDSSSTWNVACFIIPNTDIISLEGKEVNVQIDRKSVV